MKKIAIGVLAVIVVLAAAVVIVPSLIDWNNYKPDIAQAVKDATGRDLVIGGDIEVSILPEISFRVSDIKFSNAPGAAEAQMFTLAAARGRIGLFPLILGEVIVEELVISKPVVHLAVDKSGRPNWAFRGTAAAPAKAKAAEKAGDGGLPVSGLKLGDVRLEDGLVTYTDARTGQKVVAKAINVKVALAELSAPFTLTGSLTLNGDPVTLKVSLNSPAGLLGGSRATLDTAIQATHVKLSYVGGVRQKPIPALDGTFDLSIPSVGKMAAWLGRPLGKGQRDPGPLNVHAVFKGEGAKMTIEQATIKGTALSVKATGSFDGSGKVKRATFDLEAGVLDLDRYLPPPPKTAESAAAAAPAAMKRPAGDPMAAIPDEPFDLSGLKGTEAEINISIGGVKVRGFRLGRIVFAVTLKGGVLDAALRELRLYGGNVSGKVKVDGSGSALGIDAKLDVVNIDVGALARAVQSGEAKVAGIATAHLTAKGQGKSPRALVQSLVASAKLSLGGIDVKDAPGALTKLDLAVDLPGVAASPSVKANLVYNKEPVAVSALLDPLPKVLSGNKFKVELAVDSKRLKLNYVGTVQAQPVPGLGGKFALDVPSVGKLLAWVGSPLPMGQPDPGPLKISATLAVDGPKASLEKAMIDGKALKAMMTASVDWSAAVKRFDVNVEIIEADLNAYLPEQKDEKKAAKKSAQPAKGSKPAGWSEDPIDLSALRMAEGQVRLKIGKVRYGDLDIENGTATASLAKGVLKVAVANLHLAKGTVDFNATIDGSAAAAAVDYQVNVAGVQARPILKTFAGTDRLSGATALQASGRSKGANVKQLVSALNGKGSFSFKEGAIHGINIAKTLRGAGSLGFGDSSAQKTDFAELSGSFTITNGVLDNRDFKILAPLVRLFGAGTVSMPPRTVDYKIEAKLVASLKGQGGDTGLAGLPIPVTITGSWDDPSYGVDWKSVFTAAATDPSRLANMPKSVLDIGKGLGVALPVPGLSTITGTSGSFGGILDKVLKVLPSLPGTQQKQPAQQQQQQPSEEKPAEEKLPSILSPLKKLFGN